jgi:hypothetical protein
MPASGKMESSFSRQKPREGLTAAKSGGLRTAESEEGRFGKRPSLSLMDARGDAVTGVGFDARRAAAEGAQNHDRRDEGE